MGKETLHPLSQFKNKRPVSLALKEGNSKMQYKANDIINFRLEESHRIL
jgi:hypothetical protein